MATLTYNASITPSRQVTVSAGTGGSLTGSVAVLIYNSVNKETVAKLLRGILRTYHRRASKASKVSSISTSLGGVE